MHKLSENQKQAVIERTGYYIEFANQQLKLDLPVIPVNFDLKGKSSGMFVVKRQEQLIRYNEIIFSSYFNDAIINTVAHEVAHYVTHSIWGIKNTKPHGKEWKQIMAIFNVSPDVTSNYDVSHLPLHQQRRHDYYCGCMSHELSTTRHNKVQGKRAIYSCRKCHQPLKYRLVR